MTMAGRYCAASFLCGAATSLVLVCIYRGSTQHPPSRSKRSDLSKPKKDKTSTPLLDRPDLDMRLLRKAEAVIQGRTDKLIIVVERCTNDHNYSAILRTAEALGIQHCWIIDPPELSAPVVGSATVASSMQGLAIQLTAREAEVRAQHRLFARNAQEWLTVHYFTSTTECLEALRKENYAVWVTDLSQEAESLYQVPAPLPDRIAIVMGTEAVGCSQTMLDGADVRVYLPMVGFADSLNLSVATALVVQTILLTYPQYASSMDDAARRSLRQLWFPKLAQQRLLTQRQKKDRKFLQRDIAKGEALTAQLASGETLNSAQQAKVDELPSLVAQLEEWDTTLSRQAQEAVAPFIDQPPEPLSDLRRTDAHRITFVGKNTKKRNAENWKDMVAVTNAPAIKFATASFFRNQGEQS